MPENKSQIEQQLVTQLKERNKDAFVHLYDNYSAALNGVISRIIVDEAEAQDLLQDSFIKIWKKIDTYDSSKGSLFTWILNLCRNLCIDRLRSKEYKHKIQRFDKYVVYIESGEREKTDSIDLKENLNILSPEQREIIDLAYFGGYTQQEISEELTIPLGTVKTRVRAALLVLRKIYEG